jgi:Flp pilus assembly pilin Flp
MGTTSRAEPGQAATEYAGVLAAVALIVIAVAATTPLPAQVAGAYERAVCRVTTPAGDCPAPPGGTGTAPVAAAPVAQPLLTRPIAAVHRHEDRNGDGVVDPVRRTSDGRPEGTGWRLCPDGSFCLYLDENYRYEIYRSDSPPRPFVDLPSDARDRMSSWVNNTGSDLCATNTHFLTDRLRAVMPGDEHPEERRRSPSADGDNVDQIWLCHDSTWIDPDPLAPVEAGGPDCPDWFVCLYDSTDFRNELHRIDLRLDEGETFDDLDLDLPDGVDDEVASWANNSPFRLCGYETDESALSPTRMPMSPREEWRLVEGGTTSRAQDNWVGSELNNTIDELGRCDR